MTVLGGAPFRWRALTPEQAMRCRQAVIDHVDLNAIANEYGVSRRTVYRAARRAVEPMAVVEIFGYKATFVLSAEEYQPIRMTPWTPA